MKYDIVIIGAGPSGLALAHYLSNLNIKILIIDREKTIGGCHRVRRVNNIFTEHGPRIYSDTFVVFIQILEELNIDFKEFFVEYRFKLSEIGNQTINKVISRRELLLLGKEFIKLIFNNNYGININLEDYLINNNFKDDSIDIINRICKLSDGGGIDKYTLNEFLELLNQQFSHVLYQPKVPNDIGLFKIWQDYLENKGVDFYLDTNITDIRVIKNKIEYIDTKDIRIFGDKYIFAIPPINLNNIIETFNLDHNWGDIKKYAEDTAYFDYISVTFHWDTELELPKVYGFPKSSWGCN